MLARRWSGVRRALERAERSGGGHQERQYAKARNALVRLMVRAEAADSQGTLGVPAAPVEAVVASLLEILPPATTAARGRSDRVVNYLLGRGAPETTTTATPRPPSGDGGRTTTTATFQALPHGGDETQRLWWAERIARAAWEV
jgi:hypothetical protein